MPPWAKLWGGGGELFCCGMQEMAETVATLMEEISGAEQAAHTSPSRPRFERAADKEYHTEVSYSSLCRWLVFMGGVDCSSDDRRILGY